MTNKSIIYKVKEGEKTFELILEGYEIEEVNFFFQDNSVFTDRTTQEIHNSMIRSSLEDYKYNIKHMGVDGSISPYKATLFAGDPLQK